MSIGEENTGSGEANVVIGPLHYEATGDLTLVSQGGSVHVRSGGGADGIQMESETHASIACGAAILALSNLGATEGDVSMTGGAQGKVIQTAGLPGLGSKVTVGPTEISMTVGPPGAGASLTLTATAITLQVAAVKFTLSLTGIEEAVAAATRKLAITGHSLVAAETTLKVSLEGITADAPLIKQTASALAQTKATILQVSVDGIQKEQSGVTMLG